jgi:hypothetical protein
MTEQFIEGRDFYHDARGRMVLTEYFLLKRGFCCCSGCRHCPYDDYGQPRDEWVRKYPELFEADASSHAPRRERD